MKRAVFLDRDGTIIKNVHYLTDPDKVEIVPGGVEALARLRENGYSVVVVSNQSLVGRGFGTIEDVDAVNARMLELLKAGGATIDMVKYCPHVPEDGCLCRKPKPGMLLDAARELGIDLSRAAMIGDTIADVEAGRRAGCVLSVLIDHDATADYSPAVRSLPEAVDLIL